MANSDSEANSVFMKGAGLLSVEQVTSEDVRRHSTGGDHPTMTTDDVDGFMFRMVEPFKKMNDKGKDKKAETCDSKPAQDASRSRTLSRQRTLTEGDIDDVDAPDTRYTSGSDSDPEEEGFRASFIRYFRRGSKDKDSHHESTSELDLPEKFSLRRSLGLGKKMKKSKTVAKNLHGMGRDPRAELPFLTGSVFEYRRHTNGYLILVANFTNDLRGYKKDITDLGDFFVQELNYTTGKVLYNCTKEQLFEHIKVAKNEMLELQKQGKPPDKLVFVMLSHGEEDGINTCADDDGIIMEQIETGEVDSNGAKTYKNQLTSVDELMSVFKHDEENMPFLKGIPKFFVLQACQGQEMVRAAGRENRMVEQSDGDDVEDELEQTLSVKVPLDADFLVLMAATKHNQAIVGDRSGSWLIQKMLEVFRHLHETTDVEVMLKAVTLSVAEKRQGMPDPETGKQQMAVQIPMRQSTLRRLFYLSNEKK